MHNVTQSNTTITTHCTTATELLLSGTDDSSVTWRTSSKLQQCCHYFVSNPCRWCRGRESRGLYVNNKSGVPKSKLPKNIPSRILRKSICMPVPAAFFSGDWCHNCKVALAFEEWYYDDSKSNLG
jgi:hypothetical protein